MRSRRKHHAIVVLDGRTFDIVHIYVNCSRSEAVRYFLATIRGNIEPGYSDMRDELADALDRYQFIETPRITIRRW